jgi:hypothetical protein
VVELRISDPVLREEHIRTLRGLHVLRLLLRQFSDNGPYARERVLQVDITSGGGAGTGTPTGASAIFDRNKAATLITILDDAGKAALDFSDRHQINKGKIEDHKSIFIELFWSLFFFAETTVFKASVPVEFGCNECRVGVFYNKIRKNLICVISNNISPTTTVNAIMNHTQFETFKENIIRIASEI